MPRKRKPIEAPRRSRTPVIALLVVAIVLIATVDDRHVGRAADERQMIWTAVAIAQTGQLAQARGRDFTYVRSDGEAVSRFGLGMTFVQLPAAFFAPVLERRLGAGSSQPLFLLAPLVLVLLAGAWASRAAHEIGGGARARAYAVILCVLGSPLGAYAALGLSESLQAASLAGSFALALASASAADDRRSAWRARMAGAAASCALLAKSSLILVMPAACLPLFAAAGTSRTRRVFNALAGFAPGALIWAYFEFARFGRLFGSYPGERFNHPFWDGAWRLTVGPNQGLAVFFPALVVVLVVCARSIVLRRWHIAIPYVAAAGTWLILLCLAASWWAWHGVWGWGPRLLVPALPLLAAAAAVTIAAWPAWMARAFLALSIAINLPGLLQHAVPVTAYMTNLVWPRVDEAAARSLPGYAWRIDDAGSYRIGPDHVLATVARASPFIVYPWFLRVNATDDGAAAARLLEHPPWERVRPDLVPAQMPMSEPFVRGITGHARAHFWGRGFAPSAGDAGYSAVYDEGVADQIIRLQQKRDGTAALTLALALAELAPDQCHDGLVLESYRILGDRVGARAYLDRLSRDRRLCPSINVVLALFERDAGNDTYAKQILESVAFKFPADAPLHGALRAPLTAWPPDLQSMIARAVKAAGE